MEKAEGKNKRVQIIISELQKEFLDQAAAVEGVSVSALVRRIVAAYQRDLKERQLTQAARALTTDYTRNEDLTAFSALDGEDFT